jgi:hypothetical protein
MHMTADSAHDVLQRKRRYHVRQELTLFNQASSMHLSDNTLTQSYPKLGCAAD